MINQFMVSLALDFILLLFLTLDPCLLPMLFSTPVPEVT